MGPRLVSPTPFSRQFPLELFEQIVRYVELRSDLIALAQSCRLFSTLIVPKHTDYRTIRAPFTHPVLWQHLIDNPSLAENVYTLVLYDGTPASGWRIPFAVEVATGNEARTVRFDQNLLVSALRTMVSVRTFKIGTECLGGFPALHIALSVLQSATVHLPSLQELIVALPAPIATLPGPGDEPLSLARQCMTEHPMWGLRGLTKIDLEEHEGFYSDVAVARSLGPMLHASTSLQEIRLATIPEVLAPVLRSAKLPALKHLYITRQHQMSPKMEEHVVEFLRSHPTIETLQLTMQIKRWSTPVLPPYPLLPNIRHLHDAPSGLILPIFAGRVDRSLMLSTLGDFHMLAAASTTAFCAIHRQNLRKLGLTYMINLSTLRLAASIFPALEELTLPRAGDPMIAMRPVLPDAPVPRWPAWYTRLYAADDVVPQFPQLTVVANVRSETGFIPDYAGWIKEGSPDEPVVGRVDREHVEEALRGLHEKFPRLQVVNGWRL